MDDELRRLERAAAAGDPDAMALLEVARERAGIKPPKPPHPLADSWSWESAFGNEGAGVPELYERVVEVVAKSEGENEGASWVGLFKLENGEYVGITAWCDYTGWG